MKNILEGVGNGNKQLVLNNFLLQQIPSESVSVWETAWVEAENYSSLLSPTGLALGIVGELADSWQER